MKLYDSFSDSAKAELYSQIKDRAELNICMYCHQPCSECREISFRFPLQEDCIEMGETISAKVCTKCLPEILSWIK